MELRAWLLLLTNRSMSCEAIGRDIKDYCRVGVDVFMKVSGLIEAAAISGHQTDYFAISSNNVRSEWRIKTDGIWKQWENLWGDKQFLLCLSIGSIMEEILKSHAAWIQWIEMRMSRYNTSLSPSSPSLSPLSYTQVSDNDISPGSSLSSQSNHHLRSGPGAWRWMYLIFVISSLLPLSKHGFQTVKTCFESFYQLACLYKVNNGAINLANVG